MKIYLSEYWRRSSLFTLGLLLLLVIGTVCFCVWSKDSEDYIFVLCAAWLIMIPVCILLCSRRLLTYAVFGKEQITSYSLFSNKLCTVILANDIYYAVFTTPQGLLGRKKFIVLSNETFEYKDTYGYAKIRFIQHYNLKKQIVLPYSEQVVHFLDLKNWHKVN